MRNMGLSRACFLLLLGGIMVVSCGTEKEPELKGIPLEYQDKHMPQGWWTNPEMIAEGKQIYEKLADPEAPCTSCHGRNGKPIVSRTRDLRSRYVNKMTDSYMFWRISEGVPKTKMPSWKEKLAAEQIWKVMAYIHTFSHGGKAEEHVHVTQ